MGLISIETAAEQLGVAPALIRKWGEEGLVQVQSVLCPAAGADTQQCVDEDQVHEVAETIGWLHVSDACWDEEE